MASYMLAQGDSRPANRTCPSSPSSGILVVQPDASLPHNSAGRPDSKVRVFFGEICSMANDQERSESVEAVCARAQKGVIDAIPEKWRIDVQHWKRNTDARGVPEACGILTQKQLKITGQDATSLLSELYAGEVSAVEVTEAFCARAAVAHQMVNCLTAFFPEEALELARHLDAQPKKPAGPLHGLPICVKVCNVH